MRSALRRREGTWDALRSSATVITLDIWRGDSSLPEIVELVIPRPLLKATGVDGSDAIVDAINADFIRSESDDVAMFDMGGVDGAVLLIKISFNEDP